MKNIGRKNNFSFARVNNGHNSAKSPKCEIIAKFDFRDSPHGFTCIYQMGIVHCICVFCVGMRRRLFRVVPDFPSNV